MVYPVSALVVALDCDLDWVQHSQMSPTFVGLRVLTLLGFRGHTEENTESVSL